VNFSLDSKLALSVRYDREGDPVRLLIALPIMLAMPSRASSSGRAVTLILEESRGDASEDWSLESPPAKTGLLKDSPPPGKGGGGFNEWVRLMG
jgi:hypothetical protein